MKKLKKISLTNLSKEKLNKREQNQVLGGDDCCACNCGLPSGLSGAVDGKAMDQDWGGYAIGKFKV